MKQAVCLRKPVWFDMAGPMINHGYTPAECFGALYDGNGIGAGTQHEQLRWWLDQIVKYLDHMTIDHMRFDARLALQ